MEKNLYEVMDKLISLQLALTISLSLIIFFFGVAQDYIIYELYNAGVYLYNQGLMPSVILTAIENIDSIFLTFPVYFDIIWLVLALTLVGELVLSSYKVKRIGYFSALGYLTFGTLIFLFITGIYSQISNWFYDSFIGLAMPNYTQITPFFTFYLSNVGIIHLIIFAVCILLNVFDFKMGEYFIEKGDSLLSKVKESSPVQKITKRFEKNEDFGREIT